jgi:predicted GNAT family acetyltransferase
MDAAESLGTTTETARDGLEVTVVDVPGSARLEARVGYSVAGYSVAGYSVAGYSEYRRWQGHVVLLHTVTESDWRGRGIATALTRGALSLVRAAGRTVIPRCPMVADYLAHHEDQLDLVPEKYRELIHPAQ